MPIKTPPEPPGYLDDYALEEWERITAELLESKRYSSTDLHLLAAYCQEVSEYRIAVQEIQESTDRNYEVTNKDGDVVNVFPHPALERANKALKNFQSLAQQFGFTPASRKSIYGSA